MLLDVPLDWLLKCCTRDPQDCRANGEIQVLSSDGDGPQAPVQHKQALTKADSFDITFTPRKCGLDWNQENFVGLPPVTPRQRYLRDQLELPMLHKYPIPPGSMPEESQDAKQERLLRMYQEFVLELHTGTHLTQLTSSRDYSSIHCQLMEDLETLKLDQCNGRIIEFPLTSVSKVYRIVKSEGNFLYSTTEAKMASGPSVEHIVVVEFMRRKLAFVFADLQASQRFLMCMELLIRRAQQTRRGKRPHGGAIQNAIDMPRSPAAASVGRACGGGEATPKRAPPSTHPVPAHEFGWSPQDIASHGPCSPAAPAGGVKPGRLSPSMSKPPRSGSFR